MDAPASIPPAPRKSRRLGLWVLGIPNALLWGLLDARPGARTAGTAVTAAVVAAVAGVLALRGDAARSWLPYAAGLAASALVFAAGSMLDSRRRAS